MNTVAKLPSAPCSRTISGTAKLLAPNETT